MLPVYQQLAQERELSPTGSVKHYRVFVDFNVVVFCYCCFINNGI